MLYALGQLKPSVDDSAYIAPNVTLVGAVTVGARASIWFGTVGRGDINTITIGDDTNIQDSCVLHVTHKHALVIGARVTAGHAAVLHGCTIEDDCLIAMGAIVLDGARIGRGSLVGAGCVVAPGTVVPPESLVMGVPGKVIRQLSAEDREKLEHGWQNYVGYAQQYRQELQALD